MFTLPKPKPIKVSKCDCGKTFGTRYPFSKCNDCLNFIELQLKKDIKK